MIELCGSGAFCLASGRRIAATALALTYGTRLAWVGMVLTHPSFQKRGFGRLLMRRILAFCEDAAVKTVMLDATEAGRRLYESLGFRAIYRLETWTRRNEASEGENGAVSTERALEAASPSGNPVVISAGTAHPDSPSLPEIHIASPGDFEQVIELDSQFLGTRRPGVLASIGGRCWVAERRAVVEGYLFSRRTVSDHRIGPWYHADAGTAAVLLSHDLRSIAGLAGEVRLDIPAPNESALRIARDLGFVTSRFVTRMVRGGPPPGRMAEQYSIAAFATG